ncbi:MAG: class I SAM-dependent methyltransferase [Deltaproteobacteria bacterium]
MSDFPEHPWCAATLDLMMRPLARVRPKVVGQARGRVLEIGVGTGMNLASYSGIESLVGVEPDPHMLRRARERTEGLPFSVTLEQASAEQLPFADTSFDSVVMTWVLCTIPQPERALAEAFRVLCPGGRLLFAEHTRAKGNAAASLQDRLTPLWKRLGGGCHLNRDSVAMIPAAGFEDLACKPAGRESWTLLPVYRGTALRPAG